MTIAGVLFVLFITVLGIKPSLIISVDSSLGMFLTLVSFLLQWE
jgi:hypothetical protein